VNGIIAGSVVTSGQREAERLRSMRFYPMDPLNRWKLSMNLLFLRFLRGLSAVVPDEEYILLIIWASNQCSGSCAKTSGNFIDYFKARVVAI
jgi:hypothetical protein